MNRPLLMMVLIPLTPLSASAEFHAATATRVITSDPLLPISGGMGCALTHQLAYTRV